MSATERQAIVVVQRALEDARPEARAALQAVRLPELFAELSPGPWGLTVAAIELLDALEAGLAAILCARRALAGRIEADRRQGFASGALDEDEERFCSLAAVAIGLDEALARIDLPPSALPPPERHLKLSEYQSALSARDEVELAASVADDLLRYLRFYGAHPDPRLRPDDDAQLCACVASHLALLARTAERLARDGDHQAPREALEEVGLTLGASEYRGLRRQPALSSGEERGLLPMRPEDIVGNQELLAAGIKLSRAVAGFDLARGENPRLVRNPVIFALGAPGCGKTVTAHAIGNYFLDLCRENGIPARFRIIRRTDWASHYQNKSAGELLRIFQDEIFDFPGVAGAYWPDIDTAFAARDDPGVRPEDKAVLGTLFGLLDGTVGPRNGKWFLLADANFMTMDEAMVSRLSQDPYHARGPSSVEQFVELLRDKKLARVAAHLRIDEAGWRAFGEACLEHELSGRAVDNMAGKILSVIEDIELPDSYFSLSYDDKQKLVAERRNTFDGAALAALVERYVEFERDAEERARQERFEQRVVEIREQLAARVAAVSGPPPADGDDQGGEG
ncbi:MAG: AAA family ATPase [Myxococcales bacterium]|nr:AAA family ATPase [Myxococcales bacterium]